VSDYKDVGAMRAKLGTLDKHWAEYISVEDPVGENSLEENAEEQLLLIVLSAYEKCMHF